MSERKTCKVFFRMQLLNTDRLWGPVRTRNWDPVKNTTSYFRVRQSGWHFNEFGRSLTRVISIHNKIPNSPSFGIHVLRNGLLSFSALPRTKRRTKTKKGKERKHRRETCCPSGREFHATTFPLLVTPCLLLIIHFLFSGMVFFLL